jgi:hypothetical protein
MFFVFTAPEPALGLLRQGGRMKRSTRDNLIGELSAGLDFPIFFARNSLKSLHSTK